MKFKVGDKVVVKSFEEILNTSDHQQEYVGGFIKFDYTDTVYNKTCMPFFCGKTYSVTSIVNSSTYKLGTINNRVIKVDDLIKIDDEAIKNFVWNEKWLRPEPEFVLDFDGTPDERGLK